ncbi:MULTISPECIES: dihydroxyacetone kinase subunit DhaL [unclassified Arthrobacter]|uniref:dihydroxyacetone kinase subunit DhaL n=1 Tax=unclassified Arthrobacter TaxID=235627 RepID=UPI001D13B4FD|nr:MULTISPECIES: dihydroxyacetone kinase subunit DhaL [unclassified Arthrobacter]MCC3275777.1 dihydroxyacetone kinase subunit L [Arthrobacter sp. zg-Y20]MCC3278798.1 dihydroxyacetone kinase subunit L [Arthrobacter sp. zg-Y40]MCC9177172.1 dihydroxyacetone kinase subunit L [Arthrobacter sp. zg-Y750]MDK1315934.1 dihydroxyacetone kinase subunit DhaL [Arthrobacter sp. zg.Y20]MDK1326129.1 dihydroxyacetone kinase subunit DhaL [Arthrobacter sp. zg-Y1143]
MELDAAWADRWMRLSAQAMTENRQRLTTLDREIGDADHGENMERGFTAIVEKMDTDGTPDTPGEVFKTAAMTLMSKVGGAAGPLYGTAFLRASTAAGSSAALGPQELVAVLTAARDGIVARGKAETGDKTMIDAWTPAVDAAATAQAADATPVGILIAAANAAEAGLAGTEPLVARKGRASYLGERSAGHLDPGAASTALILQAAVQAAEAAA